MQNDPHRRIKAFIELTAKGTVNTKKIIKKKPGKAKDPKVFHDKMDAKLEALAKKHNVSIKLRRNKTKMSSVIVGKLKNKPYGECVKLFNAISHTSPVPQKMVENGASFRVFGPRKKLTANEAQFIVTAQSKNGKRLYWTDDGFEEVKIGDAVQMDEETADKVARRMAGKDGMQTVKAVPAEMTADESDENADADADADATSTDDDLDDTSDDTDDDDSEDEANKADIVSFISKNDISQDMLGPLVDKAGALYLDSLKTDGPVEDVVDFVYNILGPDDFKTALKALTNQQSMTAAFKGKGRGR